MSTSIVVATTTAVIVGRGGEKIIIKQGEAWDGDHPVVAAHPDMFSPDAADARGAEVPADIVEPKAKKTRRPRTVDGTVTR